MKVGQMKENIDINGKDPEKRMNERTNKRTSERMNERASERVEQKFMNKILSTTRKIEDNPRVRLEKLKKTRFTSTITGCSGNF